MQDPVVAVMPCVDVKAAGGNAGPLAKAGAETFELEVENCQALNRNARNITPTAAIRVANVILLDPRV